MKEGGKLRCDQLMDLSASLGFLSSASSLQASPVKPAAVSRSSTPLCPDEQQQLSELQPLALPSDDLPGTSCRLNATL